MDMFEKAARLKTRFPTARGRLGAEDLWDLSVEELDGVYRTLRTKLKTTSEESLLGKKTLEDEELTLQVEIIKHIVEVRLQEASNRVAAKDRRVQKQKLFEILANKKEAELQGKSVEEIQKMIDELE